MFAVARCREQKSLSASVRTEANNMAITGFAEIAEQLRRSTVVVHVANRGGGSGVIWSGDGVILTNAHVARGAKLRVELWDGREFDAAVIKRDSRHDLAAIRIASADLPAASVADSSKIRPGEIAIAIGNPLGFVGALSTGVVQAVGPVRGVGAQTWVQASVRLAPGNSGGPLANARGAVIGINTMIAGGLALAIPSNAVTTFLSADSADSWLGVTVHPVRIPAPEKSKGNSRFGLVLLEVEAGSPAAAASLLPGDILLGTEEKPFASLEELADALQGSGPRLVRLEFFRGDTARVRKVTVQLGRASGTQFVPGSSVAA
jgi:serine protease Do